MKRLSWHRRLPTAILTLLVAGYGQSVIHSGESVFVIAVRGGSGVTFRGSYLVTNSSGESKNVRIEGRPPADFTMVGASVYLNIQNQLPGGEIEIHLDANGNRALDKASPRANSGPYLEVEISKDGGTIKRQRTDAPYGVVALASSMPAGGGPRQTEFRVEGSVKFAFLTLTSETGDTEQQLVPIPFSKTLFPKEGWIVGLLAQKTLVTRPDPVHPGKTETLDDGKSGSVHVAIRVNGSVLGEAEASEPYGVASATVRIP